MFEDSTFEAEARALRSQGQGHQNLSTKCLRDRGQSLRTTSHLHIEEHITLNHSNCLIISCCKVHCANAGLRKQAKKLCRTHLLGNILPKLLTPLFQTYLDLHGTSKHCIISEWHRDNTARMLAISIQFQTWR